MINQNVLRLSNERIAGLAYKSRSSASFYEVASEMSKLSGPFLALTLGKSLTINKQVNCQLSYISPTCRALESEVPTEIIMIRGARKSAKYFFETVFTEDRNNRALS